MSEHPIEGLMRTAMNSIQDMVDVNTIIGEPIETSGDITIIPISKVSFGFAAGGSEFNSETLNEYKKKEKEEEMQYKLPFGGGSGAAVSINPVAFLVINNDNIKLMSINHISTVDKLIEYIPEIIEKIGKNNTEKSVITEECKCKDKGDSRIYDVEVKAEVQNDNTPETSPDYLEDE